MNMLIDAALAVILIGFTVFFYRKGILGAFLGSFRLIFSVSAAFLLGKTVSEIFVYNIISDLIGGGVGSLISIVISSALVFSVAFLLSTAVIISVRRLEGKTVNRIDGFLGAVFGLTLGLCLTSLIASFLYSGISLAYTISENPEIMKPYENSSLFKFLFELSVFDYVRNLI